MPEHFWDSPSCCSKNTLRFYEAPVSTVGNMSSLLANEDQEQTQTYPLLIDSEMMLCWLFFPGPVKKHAMRTSLTSLIMCFIRCQEYIFSAFFLSGRTFQNNLDTPKI